MKKHFPFGQPSDGIVQMAYMVEDVRKAMADWSALYKVGPFYLNETYKGENTFFRGKPDDTVIDVAMGFAGSMQIELIQVRTEGPSIYHEGIEKSGYGFHHVGIVAEDFDKDLARLQEQGFNVVVASNIAGTKLPVAYLEKPDSLPGYLELIPPEIIPIMMTPIYRASVGWSGKDPIRMMKK